MINNFSYVLVFLFIIEREIWKSLWNYICTLASCYFIAFILFLLGWGFLSECIYSRLNSVRNVIWINLHFLFFSLLFYVSNRLVKYSIFPQSQIYNLVFILCQFNCFAYIIFVSFILFLLLLLNLFTKFFISKTEVILMSSFFDFWAR